MKTKINYNTVKYLRDNNYHPRHIAIILHCSESGLYKVKIENRCAESTNKFMTKEERQRMYVLNKFLQLKPIEPKWSSNNYYFITVLKFLLIPRDTVVDIFKFAPLKYVAQAYKERAPKLKLLDYTLLSVNEEEYKLFMAACYNVIGDPLKWR